MLEMGTKILKSEFYDDENRHWWWWKNVQNTKMNLFIFFNISEFATSSVFQNKPTFTSNLDFIL